MIFDMTVTSKVTEGTSQVVVNRATTVDDPTITEHNELVFTVPVGATNLAISLGGLAAVRYVHLLVNAACNITFQATSGNTVFSLQAGGMIAVAAGNITAIFATNPGSTPVTLTGVCAT